MYARTHTHTHVYRFAVASTCTSIVFHKYVYILFLCEYTMCICNNVYRFDLVLYSYSFPNPTNMFCASIFCHRYSRCCSKCCSVLQRAAVYCSVMRCIAVWCSVCAALYCSVSHFVSSFVFSIHFFPPLLKIRLVLSNLPPQIALEFVTLLAMFPTALKQHLRGTIDRCVCATVCCSVLQ